MDKDLQFRFMRVQNGNDVRGAAIATEKEPVTLTPEIVEKIALSFAEYLENKTGKKGHALRIGVGHDSRVTAELMKEACFRGLIDVACYDCGLITTPAMFQSVMLPGRESYEIIGPKEGDPKPQPKLGHVYRFEITAFEADHRCPCLGYKVHLPRKGKFDVEKAKARGVPLKAWSLQYFALFW